MYFAQPETYFCRLVEDKKLTQRARLAALRAVHRPTRAMLCRLLDDPETPSRLKALAAERFAKETLRRDLTKGKTSERR